MAAENLIPDAGLVAARAAMLHLQSPVHFLRGLPEEPQQQLYGTGAALAFGSKTGEEVLPWEEAHGQWLLEYLGWDSDYFGTPTYRLFTGLFDQCEPAAAMAAAAKLRQRLALRGAYYAFSIVPAEDTAMLQALTGGGWQLVETRLHFYCPVATATLPHPAPVRLAQASEAEAIGRIAAAARNVYDRFHADPWFGEARADAFLARYAEAAVAGTYADAVLLPDEPGLPVDAFLAIGDSHSSDKLPHQGFSRIMLTAVGPQNRGWHQKLAAETVRRAANLGLAHVLMTTQATNRAVFRTCEKLGFRLGATSHVLACHYK